MMEDRQLTRIAGLLIIIPLLMAGCSKAEVTSTTPIDFDREHACSVCGMIIVDFPGSKAQIHYKNGKIDTFCSTLDMFLFYLQPDRPRHIAAIYVNDMGKADQEHPEGYWIDAMKASYVFAGDVMGPMGEALVPFSRPEDVESYITDFGGIVIAFDDVSMEMLRPDVGR